MSGGLFNWTSQILEVASGDIWNICVFTLTTINRDTINCLRTGEEIIDCLVGDRILIKDDVIIDMIS